MKQFVFFCASLFFAINSIAQTKPCIVAVDSLKGSYEGECHDGKAEGLGKALGTDKYEGNFKNGLPDGYGQYTWKNGDRYVGKWKKGLKDGKGEMYYSANDSTVKGFWKKDKYAGEYENPYEEINIGSRVSHHEINRMSKKGRSITVSMETGILAVANVDDYQVEAGAFDRFNKRELSKTSIIEFQNVTFPFKVKFNINGSAYEFEIFEPGEWQVSLIL